MKGSFSHERYQQALHECDTAKRLGQAISVRVEFEPDNIQDKNAIKFEDGSLIMTGISLGTVMLGKLGEKHLMQQQRQKCFFITTCWFKI